MLIEYDKALYAARELGSDIEFFFDKNPAIVVGKGNILRRIKSFGEFYLILVFPNIVSIISSPNKLNEYFLILPLSTML